MQEIENRREQTIKSGIFTQHRQDQEDFAQHPIKYNKSSFNCLWLQKLCTVIESNWESPNPHIPCKTSNVVSTLPTIKWNALFPLLWTTEFKAPFLTLADNNNYHIFSHYSTDLWNCLYHLLQNFPRQSVFPVPSKGGENGYQSGNQVCYP